MERKAGSTTIFITLLCFVVLFLGGLVGWQWHKSQMEQLVLENLSLQQQLEDAGTCLPVDSSEELGSVATDSAEIAPGLESTTASTASSSL